MPPCNSFGGIFQNRKRGVDMRIGAYQFAVSDDIQTNLTAVRNAVFRAAKEKVRLLVLPECALTGYPHADINKPENMDRAALEAAHSEIRQLCDRFDMFIIVGTITSRGGSYRNSAMVFSPSAPVQTYDKRALWGWDSDNFSAGDDDGVFSVDGLKIGVRICYEVRFPEYFRELYRAKTDLNVILFHDVSEADSPERMQTITAHILTRAVENVTYTLSVNSCADFQTAPTALFDRSGRKLCETACGVERLMVYDFEPAEPDFGENGRRTYSDILTK